MQSSKKRRSSRGFSPTVLLILLVVLIMAFRVLSDGRVYSDVPSEVAALAKSNSEAKEFVRNYPKYYGTHQTIDLSKEARSGTIPLLLQWDKRWGYEDYGSSVIGITGCGPTCLSMVVIGLTGDAAADPHTIARYAEECGYYSAGNGTSWTLMSEGSRHFGVTAQELPLSRRHLEQALDAGHPIILSMGPGDFTRTGHYIVLTGYTAKGFTVNDPNSPSRSKKHWSFEEISDQIRNIWSFSVS